ncbi:IucA/IucC family protein [Serratia marcescens]|uniref:IucA/IucC family protein n=1 Tax=Serratia marcescens TaxID=615 RepID=UPI002765A929|nr:IucA/IucC family protein [Serratia marcescens]MDP8763037.1 IucA/IucC family protein [Serratia marcescens]
MMELAEENGFAGQALSAQPDFSARNALSRIIRCLFAEKLLDEKKLEVFGEESRVNYRLSDGEHILQLNLTAVFPANSVINRGDIILEAADGSKTPIQSHEQLIDVLKNEFSFSPSAEGIAKFNKDVANSIHNDRLARAHRSKWRNSIAKDMEKEGESYFVKWVGRHHSLREGATLLDQWGSLEGHPYYPTWKSRPGLNDEDIEALSAEFGARVTLRMGAIQDDMVYCEKMPHVQDIRQWLSSAFPGVWSEWCDWLESQHRNPQEWLPIPLHPWHLEHWILGHFAKEIDEGILLPFGPEIETAPSMSFRTMLPTAPALPFIKLPVAIWMTSEMRSLQAKSIHMGPRISTIIEDILDVEQGFDGKLDFFREDAAWHFRHKDRMDDAEGKFLSVVFRSTDAWTRNDNSLAITVASLFTALPHKSDPLISELIALSGDTPETWFRHYTRIILKPVLAMYLIYGVALEAHQQNTQVLFDDSGRAVAMLIRDFGDGRSWAPALRKQGYELKPYIWPGILPTVFEDDIEPVRTFVVDACLVSHLHEIALCLTHFYCIPDILSLSAIYANVERVFLQCIFG